MSRFLIRFAILTLILLLGAAGYSILLVKNLPFGAMLYPILIIGIITLAGHWFLARTIRINPRAFIRRFLLLTTLRLLVYLVFLTFFLSHHREYARPFLYGFLLVYLFYQILEVAELSSKSNS